MSLVIVGVVLVSLALTGVFSGRDSAHQVDATCAPTAPGTAGIAAGSAIRRLDAIDLDREVEGAQALGSRWLRLDIDWSTVQAGGPGRYDWSLTDPAIEVAVRLGINVDGVIAYTPSWALPAGADSDKYPPTDPADYARFAAAAAGRYAAMGVHTFEIWNEPNNPDFWKPKPSVAEYKSLLTGAYAAIKSVDRGATVLSGGLAPSQPGGVSPIDFLSGLYDNGGGRSFDAVSDHPYSFPRLPTDTTPRSAWTQIAGTDPSLRSVMVAHGDGGKRIWATEFGAPTYSGGVSDEQQAVEIRQAFETFRSASWAGPLFVYSYQDLGTSSNDAEDHFGLLRHDGSHKPSWEVFRQAAASLSNSCNRR